MEEIIAFLNKINGEDKVDEKVFFWKKIKKGFIYINYTNKMLNIIIKCITPDSPPNSFDEAKI